jgi:hypothetical protein
MNRLYEGNKKICEICLPIQAVCFFLCANILVQLSFRLFRFSGIPAFQTFLLYDRSAIPAISSFSPVVVVTENNINIKRRKRSNNLLRALHIVQEIAN